MGYERQAAALAAPTAAADATGKRGVYRIASSTSNTSTELPKVTGGDGVTRYTWAGHYVRVQSRGCDTQVAFSVGSGTLNYDEASALGTGDVNAGWTIINGTYQDFIVPDDATHIVFRSSAAGGFVELYMSELLV